MRNGIKLAVASVVLAITWAVGSDPALVPWTPLGPSPARADAGDSPTATQAITLGDNAVTRRDYTGADALYRVAWVEPGYRVKASTRLLALHGLSQFRLPVDTTAVRELQGWLGPRFQRYDTEHFVVISDAGRQAAVARGRTMERARHQYFRVMDKLGFPVVPPKTKLMCAFFADHRDYTRFASERDHVDTGWIAGYYTGLGNRVVFYDDATSPRFTEARDTLEQYQATMLEAREQAGDARRQRDRASADHFAAYAEDLKEQIRAESQRIDSEAERVAESKTIHETIHLLAFNSGFQSRSRLYPFWFTEGLAASFETAHPKSSFGPDRPTPQRSAEYARAVEAGRTIPVAALIRMTGAGDDAAHGLGAEVLYAQAHELFSYLFRREPAAMRAYAESLFLEPPGEISPQRHAELFEQAFGAPAAYDARLDPR